MQAHVFILEPLNLQTPTTMVRDAIEADVTLRAVMVDPAELSREAERFGTSTPILIDSDRRASESYEPELGAGRKREEHLVASLARDVRTIRWLLR